MRAIRNHSDVPVSCKIRVLDNDDATIDMAHRLQDAGCEVSLILWVFEYFIKSYNIQFITVHGRTREQNVGGRGVPCNQKIIRRIKYTFLSSASSTKFNVHIIFRESLDIPVVANGGISRLEDIDNVLEYTKADGMMVSEALLTNPALFSGVKVHPCELALQYLQLYKQYPCKSPLGHLFQILLPGCAFQRDSFIYIVLKSIDWFIIGSANTPNFATRSRMWTPPGMISGKQSSGFESYGRESKMNAQLGTIDIGHVRIRQILWHDRRNAVIFFHYK